MCIHTSRGLRKHPTYEKVNSSADLPQILMEQIAHFFEHYKDLEPGKWVKLEGWGSLEDAKNEIMKSAERYSAAK